MAIISSQYRGVGFHCILQVWPHCGTVKRDKRCFDNSQKDLRTMKSNRLAVFAASLQYTDEVKVESRDNPQASDVGDLGNSVVGVCRGEIRRKG